MDDKIYEEKYQKGFNSGYMIAKFSPELSESIIKTEKDSAYLEGFVDAHQMYQLEKDDIGRLPIEEKDLPSWLQSDNRLSDSFNEASKGRDIEPDK